MFALIADLIIPPRVWLGFCSGHSAISARVSGKECTWPLGGSGRKTRVSLLREQTLARLAGEKKSASRRDGEKSANWKLVVDARSERAGKYINYRRHHRLRALALAI